MLVPCPRKTTPPQDRKDSEQVKGISKNNFTVTLPSEAGFTLSLLINRYTKVLTLQFLTTHMCKSNPKPVFSAQFLTLNTPDLARSLRAYQVGDKLNQMCYRIDVLCRESTFILVKNRMKDGSDLII